MMAPNECVVGLWHLNTVRALTPVRGVVQHSLAFQSPLMTGRHAAGLYYPRTYMKGEHQLKIHFTEVDVKLKKRL
jgi:hypothetical protein